MPSKVTNMIGAYDTAMRAVVTGGAGFIGSALVDTLVDRGDDVVVVDDLSSGRREHLNPAARFVERDIRDGIDVEGAEVVFHLAAQADVQTSVRRPDRDAEVNVVGTVRVAEAARRAGARLVLASTGGAIYGECAEPAREDTALAAMSPYGIAKACAELYVTGWNRIHGTRNVVLRFSNVYGPRQDSGLEGGVVSIFLERLAAGTGTVIFGDGLQVRDFLFVGDAVRALLAAAAADTGIFNIGSGTETTVLDLHRACAAVAGTELEPDFQPARLGDARRSVLDVALARRVLGWEAEVSLEDGLGATWDWIAAPDPV
jgi:UDP-glucose 4-epimerase